MDKYSKKIFTYISLKKNLPPYMNLCIKTWKKNLPQGYEIIFLNEENLNQYIPKISLPQILKEAEKNVFIAIWNI